MKPAPRILVVGYNAFDVTVPCSVSAPLDGKLEVSPILIQGGGPGATASIAMSKLGAEVGFITPLTDDLPGRLQRMELQDAQVDISRCPTIANGDSAKAVILVQAETGLRSIYWSRGDVPHLDPADISTDWLGDVDLFYHDGHEPAASLKLATFARKKHIPIVMDAGSVREGSQMLVPVSTDVIASEVFAPEYSGLEDPVAALRHIQTQGPLRVAMTLGAGGMLALMNDTPVAIPAFECETVDTTGAGDAFHAGYAFALSLKWDFLRCLKFGASVAALKCRDWGGRKGLPHFQEAVDFLESARVRPLDPRIQDFASS